jgi:DNA polymerase III subunit alpha
VLQIAQRVAEDRAQAQTNLFGASAAARPRAQFPEARPWSAQEMLDHEFAALGHYLSGHPLDDLTDALARKQVVFASAVAAKTEADGAAVMRMAGIVRARKERPAQSGGKFAWVTLSDPTGEYEVMVLPEVLVVSRDRLEPGKAVLLRAKARLRDGDLKITADMVEPLEAADLSGCRGLRVSLSDPQAADLVRATADGLRAAGGAQGELRIAIDLADGSQAEVLCPGRWPVDLAARRALKAAPGVAQVSEF